MRDNIFKIAMTYLEERTVNSSVASDMVNLRKLLDIVKNTNPNSPRITTPEQFFELSQKYEISPDKLPNIILSIFREKNISKPVIELIGEIGEYLGEKKGIGVLPNSWLQRVFFMEDLDQKMNPNKWEYFVKDKERLKDLRENKSF